MSGLVRASKYRHVFANDPKPDQIFSGFRLANQYAESNGVKASASYFLVALDGGGGPVAAVPLNKPGRFAPDSAVFSTHTAAVVDFDFSPFFDNVFGTCSEDTTVKVWQIPEDGVTANISTPLSEMRGHSKRVTTIRFHPTVGNIVLSSSLDQSVKVCLISLALLCFPFHSLTLLCQVWDISKSACICDLSLPSVPMDMVIDSQGKTIATVTKDKSIRTFDPRSGSITSCIDIAHEGAKTNKLLFLGDSGLLMSTGFNKTSTRQFKLWDPRNTSTELVKTDLDNASGIIMPFLEADSGLIFLAGKGDGNIRYYELVAGSCHPITDFKSTVPNKGVTLVPRRGVNVAGCEIARVLKVTTDSVIPLSFVVPRKSEAFQDDLYPSTIGWTPASTADEWMAGVDKIPALISLDPKINTPRFNNAAFNLDTAAQTMSAVKAQVATPSKPEPAPVALPTPVVVPLVQPEPTEPVEPIAVVEESVVSEPAPAEIIMPEPVAVVEEPEIPVVAAPVTPFGDKKPEAVAAVPKAEVKKVVSSPATLKPAPAAVAVKKEETVAVKKEQTVESPAIVQKTSVPLTPPPTEFNAELELAYDKIKRLETLVLELSNTKIQRLESMVEELNKEAAESVPSYQSTPAPASVQDKSAPPTNVADMLSKLDDM